MYQTKSIHYKSIFKQNGQTETIEYNAKGIVHKEEEIEILFDANELHIHITYGKDRIILNQGTSSLHFDYHKELWNQYQLPYGQVMLKTKLLKFEANDDRLKMKYELYDQEGLISTVYIYLSMLPYTMIHE